MFGIMDSNFRVLKIYPELTVEEVRKKTANLNEGMTKHVGYADRLPYATIEILYCGDD